MTEESPTDLRYKAIGFAFGKGFARGAMVLLAAGGVLTASHIDADKQADSAQAHAESGTNWLGKNLLDVHNETWSNSQTIKALELRVIQLEQHQTTNHNVNAF